MLRVKPPHPAGLSPGELLKQCTVQRGRAGGPGGQRRNKVETAVRLHHRATGLEAAASEQRQQAANQRKALTRLRIELAVAVRTTRDLMGEPGELWRSRLRDRKIRCNPKHADFPTLLAEALDVLHQMRGDPKRAAMLLGVTPSQLIRFVGHAPEALETVNQQRRQRGLHPLRGR